MMICPASQAPAPSSRFSFRDTAAVVAGYGLAALQIVTLAGAIVG
jgi:hypothetical protein